MVDPSNITKFDCTDEELEELMLFWVLAAGKNGMRAAKTLDEILEYLKLSFMGSPFDLLEGYQEDDDISNLLLKFGVGCYNNKSRTIKELINSNMNLKTCSREELTTIWGIGLKSASCFIIHTRENVRYCGLDTHVLKYLRSVGISAPKSTPPDKKKYLELEKKFLDLIPENMSVCDFDLSIWNKFRKSNG